MEAINRKPFQGVINIVRFNWHFYVIAAILIIAAIATQRFLSAPFDRIVLLIACAALAGIVISLSVSWYVYDCSDLYTLYFLKNIKIPPNATIVNINAGFDETSALLRAHYPDASLTVFDFYDPQKHTEISIERARKAYPAFPGTQTISTNAIPLEENSVDLIFVILSAHEIRDEKERIEFFCQLKKCLKWGQQIIVVEHLRDFNNFLAYNFGFFHFHSHAAWRKTFSDAKLKLYLEQKHTPFVSIFFMRNYDHTPS